MHPQEFVAKWRNSASTERQAYQQHFLDLCALAGHPTPAQLDPENKFFTFEAGATKQGGGHGFADVWYKGHFAIEYKGPDGNLDRAYNQLLQYRESLENPPLLIVATTQTLIIRTNFTNCANISIPLTLDDLLTPHGLQQIRNLFYNPEAFRPEKTAAQVTEEAAERFARLAAHLAKWGYTPHEVAHYLIRLLFCLFAEDIDLLPRELFTRLVESGRRNPPGFNRQVKQLFHAMAEGDYFGEHRINYFDGGLFDDDAALEMDGDAIAILHAITQLDWSAIEPAILGTLFVRSLDPAQRAKLGAQYTSKEDILLIVEPVLMAPLRRRWEEVKLAARELADKRRSAATRAVATRHANELESLVMGFAQQIRATRVLDPACGSGNFLYIALRLLMDLEKEVSNFCGEVGLQPFFPTIHPDQLYGIEINDYAHELAQATVWIGFLQWLHENGYGAPSEPYLKPLDNIKHMDAILAYDAAGKPVEPEWPAADIIIGNPPFLGGNKIRQELGDRYVEDLFALYTGRVPAFADLVCYWFERARSFIDQRRTNRAGLLATQGIRGGANRRVLERIKQTGDIFWAQSDRDWILEGANVRVSMVGFDNGTETKYHLDNNEVASINADLASTIDLSQVNRLQENAGLCYMGASPKGPFDIDATLAQKFLADRSNVHGKPNSDVVRPVLSGIDIVSRPRTKWTIDFGLMTEQEAELYEQPFEYLREIVYPIRKMNRRAAYAKRWWQYAEARPGMRKALQGKDRYIATPEVAKHRIFAWVSQTILCNQREFGIRQGS